MSRALTRSLRPELLLWGAVALGLVACATATTTGDGDDAAVVPSVEAGLDTGPVQSDAQPLVPGDTGIPDDTGNGSDGTVGDASGTDGATTDASIDMNVPDTFDAGVCVTTPPSNLCGLDPQCGCGAGTCDIDRTVTTGATVCTSAGSTPRGRACTASSQCMQGDTCESGVCRPFCTTLNAACNKTGTTKCVQSGLGGSTVPNFKVCEIACALQDASSCGGAGAGCVYDDTSGATDCAAVGTSNTCSATTSDCTAGNVCVNSGGGASYACARWCRVGFADCGSATQCFGFATPVLVNGQEYGACL
ncbi:MAG: hypothetical protein JWM74_5612 [Myxococcaceae bacterium]|nr:hypothetical protein [Myxococcaceae bacterium]